MAGCWVMVVMPPIPLPESHMAANNIHYACILNCKFHYLAFRQPLCRPAAKMDLVAATGRAPVPAFRLLVPAKMLSALDLAKTH